MSRRQKHSDKGPEDGRLILLLLFLAALAMAVLAAGLVLSGGGNVR